MGRPRCGIVAALELALQATTRDFERWEAEFEERDVDEFSLSNADLEALPDAWRLALLERLDPTASGSSRRPPIRSVQSPAARALRSATESAAASKTPPESSVLASEPVTRRRGSILMAKRPAEK